MALVAALSLRVLHFVYSFVLLWHAFLQRITRVRPNVLLAPHRRLPSHLAINILVEPGLSGPELQTCLVENVVNAVGWCSAAGIGNLSIYEEHGELLKCSQKIRNTLCDQGDADDLSSESELQYPLTPPLSDYSGSRLIPPNRSLKLDAHSILIHPSTRRVCNQHVSKTRRRKELASSYDPQRRISLCLLSRHSSKPFIASVAQSLASRNTPQKSRKRFTHAGIETHPITIDVLDGLLESDCGLSSPDFMIVHPIGPCNYRTPLELHGYPPWHIRLTEIFHNSGEHLPFSFTRPSSSQYVSLDEETFHRALDEFATAEMRFGK